MASNPRSSQNALRTAQAVLAPPAQGTKAEQKPDLFDFSNLSRQPDVAQFDLPRHVPARGVSERMQSVTGNRRVQNKMLERIQQGLGSSGAAWYNTEPLKEEFIRHLGKHLGPLAHHDFMHFVAATSPRERVPENVRKASILHHAHVSGKGMPPKKGEQAEGESYYPGLPLHIDNANRFIAGEWDPKNNPKPLSFAQNLAGNWKPGTMDTHAYRLPAILAQDPRFLDPAYDPNKGEDKVNGVTQPKRNIQQEVESGQLAMKDVKPGMWLSQPAKNEYKALEDYYKKLAKKLGISTAQAQAAAWVGGGDLTGLASDASKTFMHFFQDRVYKTAHETGVDPHTVMKDFITGKIPLRKDGGEVEDRPYEAAERTRRADGGNVVDQALKVTGRQLTPSGFYSGAAEAARNLPQQKGTAQQMGAMLQKQGVKPAELANSGANWSDNQLTMNRDNLPRFFNQRLPQLEETELSDRNADIDEDDHGNRVEHGAPQYKNYALPSGENYRELLLHAPVNKSPSRTFETDRLNEQQTKDYNALNEYRRTHGEVATGVPLARDPEYLRLARQQEASQRAYSDAMVRLKASSKPYESSHWTGTSNVLAHLRMSDRRDPTDYEGGGKMLHLDELQSDWGQDAREKGLKDPDFIRNVQQKAVQEYEALRPVAEGGGPDAAAAKAKMNEIGEALEAAKVKQRDAVPHHPYIANTNAWTDLGLKRALIEAARNDHTRLAWTPGQEHAERYGLEKRFQTLHYVRGKGFSTGPGTGTLSGYGHDGKMLIQRQMKDEELPAHIGKELADRLMARPEGGNGEIMGRHLEGDDLRVGGEGMRAYYDKLVPSRLKEIIKKLGHEAQFEPVTITHGPKPYRKAGTPINPEDLRTTLHSVRLPDDLKAKILQGLPAFKAGGDVEPDATVEKALRLTAKPAKMYAAGGGIRQSGGPDYDTAQDGPFYRVRRRGLGQLESLPGAPEAEARRPGGAPVAGGVGSLGDGAAQPAPEARLGQLQEIANSFAARHGHGPVVDSGNSESSLHKQSAIGRAFQLATTDHPDYKKAVFDAYSRLHPELVRQSGAHDYDSLRAAAYHQLGKEVKTQFDALPLAFSFHHGEGDYPDSKSMRADVLGHGHLATYQGGERHDFLHEVDPATKLNGNEMFRAVHDAYGHALHGSGFGAKGEERAWNAHRQMFSPLAALAMSAETRGQNSFVNYTPINAALTARKHEIEAEIARSKRRKDAEGVAVGEAEKKKVMAGWQYAPQKAVLLPPEMISPEYAGGMPDYVQKLIKPEPGTGFSSPVTHFSHESGLSELDPKRYGTGIPGDERSRVLKRPGGVKERTYGYLGEPGSVKPEPGLGANQYRGQVDNLYDLTRGPLGLHTLATEANRSSPLGNFNPGVVNNAQAMNDVERMAKENGFSGVANPRAAYPMAAMFGSVPVKPVGEGPS